jgi:hypothetical protein
MAAIKAEPTLIPPPSLTSPDLPITTQADDVEGARVKSWRSGQPYRYPVPKPEGDPWEIVLAASMRKDRLQCMAWKEQIQWILVVVWFYIPG